MNNINKLIALGLLTTSAVVGMAQTAAADTKMTYTTEQYAIIVTPIDYDTKEQIADPVTETCEVTYDSNGGVGMSYPCPIISGYSYLEGKQPKTQTVKLGDHYIIDMYYYKDGNYNHTGTWSRSNGYWNYITKVGMRVANVIGWIHPNNNWYYMDSDGNMKVGWIKNKGNIYYLHDDGSMAIGWVKSDSKWYYMNENGQMLSNTTVNGYKLGKDGAMVG